MEQLPVRRGADRFVARLLAERPLAIEDALLARPARGAAEGSLELEADGGAARALLVRHGSGALTLHGPVGKRGSRFHVPLRPSGTARAWLVRVRDRLAERALEKVALVWEEARFSGERRAGFVDAGEHALAKGVLQVFDAATLPPPPARTLLLVHGIASDAASAFGALATTRGSDGRTLLARLAARYDGRVVAFNHPTVSVDPGQNARALLSALPSHPVLFDVVTHSRGGVLLRTLVEAAHDDRFVLGRAALLAAPNEGSALAEPERWATWLSWLANLADLFPQGFANALSLVAEGLVWLARRVDGVLPGVAALAPGSPTLSALRGRSSRYAAIGASFSGAGLLARMVDAGVDSFFSEANDLVVPSRGAFPKGLAPERAACFGRGGNLLAPGVHHVNLFEQRETVDALGAFLSGESLPFSLFDPAAPLPFGGTLRGSVGLGRAGKPSRAVPRPRRRERAGEPFDLVILGRGRRDEGAQVLASWRGARVVAPLPTRGGEPGERMRRLIAFQEKTLASFTGRGVAPGKEEIETAGALLFETLFSGEVLRLWDRARGSSGLLDVKLTSSLAWIADKPWELCFDSSRRAFLALDGIRLSRSVFGAVPAAPAPRRRGPLRILVIAAQPQGTAPLSAAAEEETLRHAFAQLTRAGKAVVDVVRRATPARLHERIARTRPHVVHYIGHGEWEAASGRGVLLLEDARGHAHALDAAALRALFTARGLALVVLNACETGRGGRNGLARGVAQALVAGGIPAVIANQYPVLDESAALFTGALAAGLAAGAGIAESVREARLALAASPRSALDWAVPVLYGNEAGRSIS